MADLGLDAFETDEDCCDRQHRMLRALRRTGGSGKLIGRLDQCTASRCALHRCRDGCHHGTRRQRLTLVPQADRLLREQPGPLLFVTVVHPAWEVAHEAGPGSISIPGVKQWLKRRLQRLQGDAMAAGSFEVSLNIDQAGTKTWVGHVHFNCAGATREQLHTILRIGSGHVLPAYTKPVVITDVSNTARQQAYALKRLAQQRIAYLGPNGRQQRRTLPLDAADQLTFDRWLCKLSIGERVFLFGCKRLNGHLVEVAP